MLLGLSLTQLLLLGFVSVDRALGGSLAAWTTNGNLEQLVLVDVAGAVAFLVATLLVGKFALRLSAADLRWTAVGPRFRGWLLAFLAGTLLSALAMLLGILVGDARWIADSGSFASYAGRIGLAFLILLPGAFFEELVFRGIPMAALNRVAGKGIAIGVTALLFALAHGTNPGVTTLGIGNICVAGVLLGVMFFAPGGIWTAIGLHLGWNWGLAALDAPISGLNLRIPLIDYVPGQPGWLTGGSFGPEGGVLATIVLAIATVIAGRFFLAPDDTATPSQPEHRF